MFYKIYKSGDNYEIYTYENGGGDEREERNNLEGVLDGLGNEKELKSEMYEGYLKKKRREQTLRDNAMGLKRMARQYFQGNCFFVTLTLAENNSDIDKNDRRLKSFIKKLRDMYGDVSYVAVREKQKRGALHYHLLLKNDWLKDYYEKNIPSPVRRGKKMVTSEEQKEFERYVHEEFWKYGFVNFTMIDFVDDTGAYLTKYMTKAHIKEMEWLENRRLVLRSADIKKIEPLDSTKDFDLIKEILENIDVYKSIAEEDIKNKLISRRVFTNGYESKFVGKVLYYDVHLKRL